MLEVAQEVENIEESRDQNLRCINVQHHFFVFYFLHSCNLSLNCNTQHLLKLAPFFWSMETETGSYLYKPLCCEEGAKEIRLSKSLRWRTRLPSNVSI